MTFWGFLVGYMVYWIGMYGVNQPCVQRFCAMKTQRMGKMWVMLCTNALRELCFIFHTKHNYGIFQCVKFEIVVTSIAIWHSLIMHIPALKDCLFHNINCLKWFFQILKWVSHSKCFVKPEIYYFWSAANLPNLWVLSYCLFWLHG